MAANDIPFDPILLDTKAVSKMLCISTCQVRIMLAAGDLPPPVKVPSRKMYWRWADLAKWAQELPAAHVA